MRRIESLARMLAVAVSAWFAVTALALATGFPRTVVDGTGKEITLREPPTRIFSAGLAMDNILLSLVEPERVAAVTRLTTDPESSYVEDKVRSGMMLVDVLNAEQVVAADPDIVLVTSWSDADAVRQIQDLGYPVYTFTGFSSVADSLDMILRIGEITGADAKAEALVAEFHAAVERIAERIEGRARPRVLYWNSWGNTTGTGTPNHDIIEMAGGINVAAEQGIEGWKEIGAEAVLQTNPDVIITDSGEEFVSQILADGALTGVAAVKEAHVYQIDHMAALNHYFIRAIDALARKLHPEVFE